VDGVTAAENAQPSWLGEGWGYEPGFIERAYRPCKEDVGTGENVPHWTAANTLPDLCYRKDNAKISWNGRATELVKISANQWKLADDDGSRVELVSDSSNNITGYWHNERWKLTTSDGTQYWFGKTQVPKHGVASAVTGSVLGMQVTANHTGEPCFSTTSLLASTCGVAYRWNLDYVVDVHGNSMAYYYTRYTNVQRVAGSSSVVSGYYRSGLLAEIDYGLRAGSEGAAPAPARLHFHAKPRCFTGDTTGCLEHDPVNWPDTPWDLECSAAPCPTPSFWSNWRLSYVLAQAYSGTGDTFTTVDQWVFDQSFPDTDNDTSPALWLGGITRTGLTSGAGGTGAAVALPSVSFRGIRKDQRAFPAAGMVQPRKYRIEEVNTETGLKLRVTYAEPHNNCLAGAAPAPANNNRRCFPQYDASQTPPGWSWWHKYLVAQVIEDDMVGGSPDVQHRYTYAPEGSSPVLWAYSDDSWGSPEARRTWSQWRGHPYVKVTEGIDAEVRSQTVYRYFRGMDGDYAGNQTWRSVTLTNSLGESTPDYHAYAGMLYEVEELNGPDGPPLRRTITDPVRLHTGHRTDALTWAQPWMADSYYAREARTRTSTLITAGPAAGTWRTTQTDNTFDGTYGTLTRSVDAGDTAVTDDQVCTDNTYVHTDPNDDTRWVTGVLATSVTTNCANNPGPGDHLAGTRTFYDGHPSLTDPPTRALPTRVEQLAGFSGSTPTWTKAGTATFDALGRPKTASDALDRTTSTEYTPGGAGLLTSTKVTNPLGHFATTTVNVRGLPVTATDANGKVTTGTYDQLGRLTKVRRPGLPAASPANVEYVYSITKAAPPYVQTKTLGPNGNQISSFDIYDGLLRLRQTQSPAPQANGGRMITDVGYDTRGNTVKQSMVHNTSAPSATLVSFADTAVARQTRSEYDVLRRKTSDQTWKSGTERWRTSYGHGGDRTTVDPPDGGTATTTVVDAHGRTTQLLQHHGASPTGAADTTSYGYDLLGKLTSVADPAGNDWTWTYDLRGRQTEAVDPDKGTTAMAYDDAGQLTSTTDARGTLAYKYDDLGRKTAVHQGSLTGTKRAGWAYDTLAKGQLTSSVRYEGGRAYEQTVTSYDEGYRPLGTSVKIPAGGPTSDADLVGTWTSDLTYKVDGSLATQTYPAVGGMPAETVTYSYDNTGAPLTMAGQNTYVSDTRYDNLGTVNQRTLGGPGIGTKRVRQTLTTDEATGRLFKNETHTENPTTPDTWDEKLTQSLAYDKAGNLTRIAETTGAGATITAAECFTYDHQRRLTDAWTTTAGTCQTTPSAAVIGGADPYWHTYAYDVVGNRTGETVHGTGGGSDTVRNYTYPAAGGTRPHALTSVTGPAGTDSYSYDNTGNMLTRNRAGKPGQTLTWDPEGHLATVVEGGQTTSYLYDADGNRLIRRTPGKSVLYLGGTEIHTSGAGPTAVRYYNHGGTVVASRTSTAALTWHTDDHHGTAQVAITATNLAVQRRKQTPFGQDRGTPPAAWPVDRGFVGGTNDPTGLVHLGAREYDPGIGRFISVDPVHDLNSPQQWNGYAYANNNPVTLSDPDGLDPGGGQACDSGHCSKTWGKVNHRLKAPRPPSRGGKSTGDKIREAAKGAGAGIALYNHDLVAGFWGFVTHPVGSVKGFYNESRAWNDRYDQPGFSQVGYYCVLTGFCQAYEDYQAGNVYQAAYGGVQGVGDTAVAVAGAGAGGGASGVLRGIRSAGKRTHCSFSASTAVVMADGTTKPISELKPGDKVLAADPETGEKGPREVTDTFVHDDYLMDLVLDNGDVIVTTEDHPFWNATDRQWQRADELTGDTVLRPDGRPARVIGGRTGPAVPAPAYNLTVDDLHTYYVVAGNTPVLVHNDGGEDFLTPDDLSPEQRTNYNRYVRKLPAGAGNTVITRGANSVVIFNTDVPGRVPGSYATYTKTIDAGGVTIDYKKTTVTPDGSIAHVKDKFNLPGGGC
jgi:RHS repeat-associated protein